MSDLLAATLPFFCLVALGALSLRLRLLPASALPGLNAFTLYLALPALLFRLGAGGALAHLGWGTVAVYAAAGLVLLALIGPPLHRRCGPKVAGFAALATAFPNSGFLGLPLLLGLLGPDAAGPVAATLLVDVFLVSSLCLWRAHRGEAQPLAALRPVWRNPLPWAIAAGAAADWVATQTGWVSAPVVDRVLALLAAAATPVALFALGALLAVSRGRGLREGPPAGRSTDLTAVGAVGAAGGGLGGRLDRGAATDVTPAAPPYTAAPPLWLVPAKLLLHPALVLAAAVGAARAGHPLAESAALALVLTAALPCASNVVLLADRHGADAAGMARLVVASTVAALATFLAWSSLLMPA
jgi:predicted permease